MSETTEEYTYTRGPEPKPLTFMDLEKTWRARFGVLPQERGDWMTKLVQGLCRERIRAQGFTDEQTEQIMATVDAYNCATCTPMTDGDLVNLITIARRRGEHLGS